MQDFLISLSTHHAFWVYFIIIFTACIEGPILSILGGILIKLGYFPFAPLYIALMLGDIFGDTAWYFVGRRWGHAFIRRFGKYVSINETRVDQVMKIFHKYTHYVLIISKITNGFGLSLVTLLAAGMARIPFWKYLGLNIIGQFVWSGLLIGVGYFFSHMYLEIDSIIGKISIIGLFIVLIFLFMGFVKYMKGRSESL